MARALADLAVNLQVPRVVSSPDSDSDTDSEDPSPRRNAGGLHRSQVIHSGHFMVSSPHSDSLTRRRDQEGPVGVADFGPRSIDPTLTRLFECLSLAYSGKLVSPKWKNFKGLKLLCRDKIRLNNAIWRAWYIQYVQRRKSPVCGFVTPLQGSEADEHRKPEAVVLEGNYWKRRIEVVMREYHKWRIYYKKRLRKSSREGDLLAPKQAKGGWRPPERWCEQLFSSVVPVLLRGPEEEPGGRQLLDLDCFLSDISDTLFTMTQPSPSSLQLPQEDAYVGNADMIQPDLTPLQPSLDDFMEISDFFTNYRPPQTPISSNFLEPPSFSPMADSLFGSGILGPEVVPTAAASSSSSGMPHLLGNTRLQTRNSCSGSQDPNTFLSSDFLLPEDPKTKLPPAPTALPLLPYPAPVKAQGLEPCAAPHFPTIAPPPALLPEEPVFSARFPIPTVPPALAVSPLPVPATFSSTPHPGPGPAPPHFPVDHLPHGYPEPAFGPHFTMPQNVQPNRKHPASSPGGQKASPSTLAPATASSTTTARDNNPCLTQLLRAAKPEQALEPPIVPSTVIQPSGSPQETVPHAFFPPIPAPTPPRPPPGPLAPPRSLIVPKVERLSPPALSGNERRLSGELNSIPPPGAPSIQVSPPQPILSRGRADKMENRRITHISAEQKRRFNIKLGFDTLHGLVSTLSAQPSLKVSKATTLQKTAEYIIMLQQERAAMQEEAQQLRDEIEELNAAINLCQQQLPATGVPITHQRFDQMRDMFDDYVRTRTLHNWKFWVFSILIRPLFESFNGMVSTASLHSLRQTSLAWLDQYCSLPALRPNQKANESKKSGSKKQKQNQRIRKEKPQQHNFTHRLLAAALKSHSGNISCMDFSSNGKYLATCADDRTVRIWSTKDFLQREHRSMRANVELDHATLVRFSPDCRAFIVWLANADTLRVFKMTKREDGGFTFTATPEDFPKKHKAPVINIGIADTGKFIMTASSDTTVLIWNLKGQVLSTINTNQMNNTYAAISPCSRFVGSCGFTPDVKVWEVCFGKKGEFQEVARAFELKGHSAAVHSFAFSNDARRMASVSKDGTWRLWDTDVEYKKQQDPYLLRTGLFAEASTMPCRLALSPDTHVLALASGTSVHLFNTRRGEKEECFKHVHGECITDLTFDITGHFLASCGDRAVRLFHNTPGHRAVVEEMQGLLKRASSESTRQRLQQQLTQAQEALKSLGSLKK